MRAKYLVANQSSLFLGGLQLVEILHVTPSPTLVMLSCVHLRLELTFIRTRLQLQEMCSNLESEAGRQARHAASQGELTLKLSELTTVLAAEERKTENLARRLQHRETEFNALRLRLKVMIFAVILR